MYQTPATSTTTKQENFTKPIDKAPRICYINCTNTSNTVVKGGGGVLHLDCMSGKSLHEQIEDEIKQRIISGILAPDEQIPSVRETAISLTVNPNTVQRAYKQLEQDGFIYSIKGKGSFVAKLPELARSEKSEELFSLLADTVRELAFLGADEEKVLDAVREEYEKRRKAL